VLGGELTYQADLTHLDCEDHLLKGPIRARLSGGPRDLGRGDRVRLVGDVGIIELRQNRDLPSPWPSAARRRAVVSGVAYDVEVVSHGRGFTRLIDRARARVRERIQATFAAKAVPLARALVLGESDLDDADNEAFRKAGLLHLLAVSGTHLVFAVVAIVRALSFVLVRIEALAVRVDVARIGSALGVPLALMYSDYAGGSGSAWRAAYMLAAVLGAKALGRRSSASRSMAAALLCGALLDPLTLFDVSFMLSAAATAGLLWLGPLLSARCGAVPSRVARFVARSMAATVSSMLPCAPLLALLGPELTLAGLFATVVAAPFGEFVSLPLCLVHGVLAPFPHLERGLALVASGALIAVQQIAQEAASVDGLSVRVPPPSAWHFAVLVVAGAGLLTLREGAGSATQGSSRVRVSVLTVAWLAALVLGLGIVELALRRAGSPQGLLRLTALDIGQGDASLIDWPDGSLWLVDGGGVVGSPVDPGKAVILPVLRARRRDRLDVVVLSHPHPDHFTGLVAVLQHVRVGELWDTGQGEAEGAGPVYRSLLETARRRKVSVRGPAALCADLRHLGGALARVLGPCPNFVSGRGANDNSLVLKLSYQQRSMLLMGDAEHLEEEELGMRYGQALKSDVLKAGHHGSRTSSNDALLQLVRPELATVSCGLRNHFGHPHAEALARLERARVSVLRLDRVGSVSVVTDGHDLAVYTAEPGD
jgi:competence protein ComEC